MQIKYDITLYGKKLIFQTCLFKKLYLHYSIFDKQKHAKNNSYWQDHQTSDL